MNDFAHVAAPTPWYREPWPWLLMAGPATVVVAGFFTLGLAIHSADGLVADDYYKEGKAINMTMHRDERARELGYQAHIVVPGVGGQVALAFGVSAPPVQEIKLSLHHPTRSGFDRQIVLAKNAHGLFTGTMPRVEPGRWSVILEDKSQAWRLTGDWQAGRTDIHLGRAE